MVMVFACAGQSRADTLYYDDFSGDGASALNGTMPDVGLNAWTAPSGWTDDGQISGFKLGAYLPFIPQVGNRYVLSGTLNFTGSDGWVAIGFSSALTTAGAISQSPMNGTGWFYQGASGGGETFMGPGTGGGAGYASTPGPTDFMTVLDTRPANWTVEWFLAPAGGPLVSVRGPEAWTTNPTIQCIMLNAYNGIADFDELRLTRADPLVAHDPDPMNFERDVEFDLSDRDVSGAVSWLAPTDSDIVTIYGYDVYMDTDENKVINATAAAPGTLYASLGQAGTDFDPGADLLYANYYWRVDALVDLASVPGTGPDVVTGYVWTFRTWEPDGSLVDIDPFGNLHYTPDAHGNVIPDFSMVGYHQGNRGIPDVPVEVTLSPSTGDRTADIQNAIDTVAARTPDPNGHRGAVLLKAGSYEVTGTLNINTSGLVIRGEGKDANGTVVELTGTAQIALFRFNGSANAVMDTLTEKQVTDTFVPIGAKSITVESGHTFRAGDRVLFMHTSNAAWIAALGMDQLVAIGGEGHYNWGPYTVPYKRRVTAVAGNVITLDAPLVQPIDDTYFSATLAHYTWPGKIEECGLENMRLLSSYASETDEAHGWVAVALSNIENAWVREVEAYYFGGAGFQANAGAYQVTVQDCGMYEYKSIITGGRRYGFYTDDSDLILFKNCESTEGRHGFAQGSMTPGPNVYTYCTATGSTADSGPHHRWSTGTLWDNVSDDGAVNVQNRMTSGSGHGWAGAQQVLWNCTTPKIILHDPPSDSVNWAIGCIADITNIGDFDGVVEPLGVVESQNTPIADIPSLYTAQLNQKMRDTVPPTPYIAAFVSAPTAAASTAISMTATAGTDATGPVEYYFDEISGNPGGTASGWQHSASYLDTGLTPETQYTYTVQMRDALGNTGTVSSAASATTPEIEAIRYIQITGDADCGITSNNVHTYTHALDFGLGTPSTVNGLEFVSDIGAAVTGGPSNSGSRAYGSRLEAGNTPPDVTGDIAGVFTDMAYWGGSGYIELTGLTPGQWYDVRLYDRAWSYPATREYSAGYDVDSDGSIDYVTPMINTDNPTQAPVSLAGNGSWVMSHVYQAGAAGTLRINIITDSYHLYGLTNQEIDVTPPPEPALLQIASAGGALEFAWKSWPNEVYTLEFTTSLVDTNWAVYHDGGQAYENMPADESGTNTLTVVPVSGDVNFFRVISGYEL
jgi:hypothetical protein